MDDELTLYLFFLLQALLGGLEVHIVQDSAHAISLPPFSQECLHSFNVVFNPSALFFRLQLLHSTPRDPLNLLQLQQVFFHFADFLEDIEMVGCYFALEFIEIIGDVSGEKREDVCVVMHVVRVCNGLHVAWGTDEFFPDAFGLDTVMLLLPNLAFLACLATLLDDAEHLGQPHAEEETGLVVIGLFGNAGRCERVLNHHGYIA